MVSKGKTWGVMVTFDEKGRWGYRVFSVGSEKIAETYLVERPNDVAIFANGDSKPIDVVKLGKTFNIDTRLHDIAEGLAYNHARHHDIKLSLHDWSGYVPLERRVKRRRTFDWARGSMLW